MRCGVFRSRVFPGALNLLVGKGVKIMDQDIRRLLRDILTYACADTRMAEHATPQRWVENLIKKYQVICRVGLEEKRGIGKHVL